MPNSERDLASVFDLAWPGHGERLVTGDLAHLRERAFVRVTKSELELPPLEIRVERVELDPAHRQIYDAMVERVRDWAAGTPEATAAEAGKVLMRLIAAVTNPAAVFAPGSPWALPTCGTAIPDLEALISQPGDFVRPAKILRAAEIVASNRAAGKKTLVWSNFLENVRSIAEALAEHSPAVIVGATPVENADAPTDRVRELERFRSDPDCWVLVATPQTLGEGVSLHETCTEQVHVDRVYSAGTWLQSIDRTHRLGLPAEAMARCTVIEAVDTIDERVAEVLSEKVAAMAAALDDPDLLPVADPFASATDPVRNLIAELDVQAELSGVVGPGEHRRPELPTRVR